MPLDNSISCIRVSDVSYGLFLVETHNFNLV